MAENGQEWKAITEINLWTNKKNRMKSVVLVVKRPYHKGNILIKTIILFNLFDRINHYESEVICILYSQNKESLYFRQIQKVCPLFVPPPANTMAKCVA